MVTISEKTESEVAARRFTSAERDKLWQLFHPVAQVLGSLSGATLRERSAAEADDVVQETFIAFARGAVQGRLKCLDMRPIADITEDELGHYAEKCRYYLVHNVLHKCDEFRRKAKLRRQAIEQWFNAISERVSDPMSELFQREQIGDLQHTINHLPDRLRTVLMLHFYGQCTTKEIALQLGITPRMVRYRLREIQERLRGELSFAALRSHVARVKRNRVIKNSAICGSSHALASSSHRVTSG